MYKDKVEQKHLESHAIGYSAARSILDEPQDDLVYDESIIFPRGWVV